MIFLLCLMAVCGVAAFAYLAFSFARDFKDAWREEFRTKNRRLHHIEIGFRACKPQEQK